MSAGRPGPDPEEIGFTGHWEQRGMVRYPVMPADPYDTIKAGGNHVPSHLSYEMHLLFGETPCEDCKTAERVYLHNIGRSND